MCWALFEHFNLKQPREVILVMFLLLQTRKNRGTRKLNISRWRGEAGTQSQGSGSQPKPWRVGVSTDHCVSMQSWERACPRLHIC